MSSGQPKNQVNITLLGLGPGDADLLTRQALQLLGGISEIYLRTHQHPAVNAFPENLQVHSFDDLFESSLDNAAIYAEIVERVLVLGRRPEGVVYAVPGHPLVGEATAPEIARRAEAEGLTLRVVQGLSLIEPALTALRVNPMLQLTLLDALELSGSHVPPFPIDTPALIVNLSTPAIASDVKRALNGAYPPEHPVQLVHAAGTSHEQVERLSLNDIDSSQNLSWQTSLYVPPLDAGTSFEAFQEVIAHLRAPDGCPWDREQTHLTLRPHLLEETYEALAALDSGDVDDMREEFGDLLLQIVLNAQIAAEAGEFTMGEVLKGIHDKIVRRHPHVFGSVEIRDTQRVLQNWERLKEAERAATGKTEKGLLDGVSVALPALVQAEQYQQRAARVGFDWPDVQGVLNKLEEELSEVHAAQSAGERDAEIGDLLFAVVNLARWYKVDAESALRESSARFRKRFGHIEATAHRQGRSLSDLSLDEMEALWQEAKRL